MITILRDLSIPIAVASSVLDLGVNIEVLVTQI